MSTAEKRTKVVDGKEVEYTPALFSRTYELSVVEEGNAKGDWIGFKIEKGKRLEELPDVVKLLDEIKKFRASLKRGEIKTDMSQMGEAEAGDRSEAPM